MVDFKGVVERKVTCQEKAGDKLDVVITETSDKIRVLRESPSLVGYSATLHEDGEKERQSAALYPERSLLTDYIQSRIDLGVEGASRGRKSTIIRHLLPNAPHEHKFPRVFPQTGNQGDTVLPTVSPPETRAPSKFCQNKTCLR